MCFFLFGVVFSWGTPSECAFRSMERWLSGLRHTPGKRAYPNRYRGFESLPLRHVPQTATPSILASMPQESLAAQSEPLFRVSEQGKEGGNTFKDPLRMSFRAAFGTDFDSHSESMLQK